MDEPRMVDGLGIRERHGRARYDGRTRHERGTDELRTVDGLGMREARTSHVRWTD